MGTEIFHADRRTDVTNSRLWCSKPALPRRFSLPKHSRVSWYPSKYTVIYARNKIMTHPVRVFVKLNNA